MCSYIEKSFIQLYTHTRVFNLNEKAFKEDATRIVALASLACLVCYINPHIYPSHLPSLSHKIPLFFIESSLSLTYVHLHLCGVYLFIDKEGSQWFFQRFFVHLTITLIFLTVFKSLKLDLGLKASYPLHIKALCMSFLMVIPNLLGPYKHSLDRDRIQCLKNYLNPRSSKDVYEALLFCLERNLEISVIKKLIDHDHFKINVGDYSSGDVILNHQDLANRSDGEEIVDYLIKNSRLAPEELTFFLLSQIEYRLKPSSSDKITKRIIERLSQSFVDNNKMESYLIVLMLDAINQGHFFITTQLFECFDSLSKEYLIEAISLSQKEMSAHGSEDQKWLRKGRIFLNSMDLFKV
ncbi:MAG: hypothetical protein ACOVOR_03545 [Rhabdochlamydiaceae bacterium]